MNIIKTLAAAALLSLGIVTATAPTSHAATKYGVLTCNVEGGWGAVIGSTKDVECVFVDASGHVGTYIGHISKIGLDIGYVGNKTLSWAVFGPAKDVARNLRGTYIGANAEASVIVGAGANALIGGVSKNLILNPISIQSQTGLNLAAGVASLTLN